MSGLTRLAIKRPLTMLMLILGLVIMGVRGYGMLKVDRYPKVNLPYVAIICTYPGAAPEDVENDVVKPIEDAVAGVSGVDTLSSTSRESLGMVSIAFKEGVDGNQAATDVERAVNSIKATLPSDAKDPTIVKADVNALAMMDITLSGKDVKLEDLYRIADQEIKPRLQAAPGVAAVSVSGGLEREIQVQADPGKLAGYQVTLAQLSSVLARENVDVPSGAISAGPSRSAVRSLGRFSSLEEIGNVIVTTGAKRVYLKDLATVADTHKEVQEILRLNGQETVGLSITKQSDANTVQTSRNVRATLATLEKTLPSGLKFTVVNDDSEFTRASVDAVQKDLLLAVLITGLVLLLFLHQWRSTLTVLLAVPTSLISTFLVMYAAGFSLDMLSLMALALTIGILVDDSIVVLENIHRHLADGEEPHKAAFNGRAEIGMAALAITFCDVVVYLPVAFMSGIVGQFFREYGITIATATLFSLFVSFTLTPMLASRWLKSGEHETRGAFRWFVNAWEGGYERLGNAYAGTLDWSLRHRPLILFISAAALAIAVAFIPLRWLGTEFMPNEDDGQFTVSINMPAGSSLAATDEATQQAEALLKTVPEVENVLARVGSSSGSFFGSQGVTGSSITVKLVDKGQRTKSTFEISDAMRPKLKEIPNANIQIATSSFMGGALGAGLTLQVEGPDMDTLIILSSQIADVMRAVPGVVDVRNNDADRSPELQAKVDRGRLNDQGLSAAEVGTALRTAVAGAQVSTYKPQGEDQMDLTLIANEATRSDADQLRRLPLKFTGGTPILLGQVSSVQEADAPAQIKRFNRERQLTLTSAVVGRSIGDVATDVNRAIARSVQFPPGYRIEQRGSVEYMGSAFADLTSALLLSIILIYMLMVALYESLTQPLAIMFSLPVSLVGAFGGLFLTGNTLNIFSLLGIVMLMGIVVKNAILLVDFADILRKRGYPRHKALVEAGRMRLRPILMTTACIVFAMIPLVLKLEAGAEMRAPLAAVVIGGVISSTLLTLVLVPTMYTYLDSLETFVRVKIRHGKPRFEEHPAEQPNQSEDVRGAELGYELGTMK